MAFHEKFEIDPETGFLTPKKDAHVRNGFTAAQKTEWLLVFRRSANFGKASDAVGINRRTVHDHLNGDQKFKTAKQAVVESICDDMEESLFLLAKRNPTAAFGILKAYRGRIWREKFQEREPNKEEKLKGLLNTIKDEDAS